MIHFGALVNNTAFQYNPLNRQIIKETIKLSLANSYIFRATNSNKITVRQNVKPANISDQIIYQVQSGDSLETIAKRYNVTVQSIKQINNTVGNKLYTGQHLKINSSISEKEKT